MNPNQMNVAKAMVAQHEFLEEARRSRLQAEAGGRTAKATHTRKPLHARPFSALLRLGPSGRR